MNEHISRRLREAAEAHHPDRARMLARVERGAASGATVRRRTLPVLRSWPRAVLAALAAAGILATGGFAVAGIVGTPPAPPSDGATAPAVPSPTAAPSTGKPAPTTVGPAPATTPADPRPTPSASSRVQSGPLRSDGSVDPHSTVYWAQSNLVLGTAQPLTALTVEVRIALTGGVRDAGHWQTRPSDDFTVTVRETGGALVYRWVLKPGRTTPAGQHAFAVQYHHAVGVRRAADDGYRVDAQAPGGPATVWGGFTN